MNTINPQNLASVFHSYDIRGRDPKELDEKFFKILAKAFVTFLDAKKIAVGYDFRRTSSKYKQAFIQGAIELGCDVVDLGEIATEMLYFAVGRDDSIDGGVTITASHNPAGWNGCKLVGHKASPISGDFGLPEIKDLMLKNKFPKAKERRGKTMKLNIYPDFKKEILKILDIQKIPNLNIVVDAGNGIGGKIFNYVFGDLDLNVIKLYFDIDDNFPNHVPNPLEIENVKDLIDKVKEINADLGIAIDGDADRTFFVDKKGRNPNGLFTGTIFAEQFLKQEENGTIIIDPRTVRPFINLKKSFPNSKIIKSKAGHSHFKNKMKKYNAIFGAEKSSHFYYRDFFFADSGMLTIAYMLKFLSEGLNFEKKLDYLYKNFQESGEVNYKVENPEKILNLVEKYFQNKYPNAKPENIDGITFREKNWGFNLRKSNTQPLVRLNVEASSREKVIEIFKEVEKILNGKRDNMPIIKELI